MDHESWIVALAELAAAAAAVDASFSFTDQDAAFAGRAAGWQVVIRPDAGDFVAVSAPTAVAALGAARAVCLLLVRSTRPTTGVVVSLDRIR